MKNPKKRLSKKQQAIAIAKDVLKQLSKKNLVAVPQHFVTFSRDDFRFHTVEKSEDFIGILDREPTAVVQYKVKAPCEVCAAGSLLISSLNLYNNLLPEIEDHAKSRAKDYGRFLDGALHIEQLYKYFDRKTVMFVEYSFEITDTIEDGGTMTYVDFCNFRHKTPKEAARLLAFNTYVRHRYRDPNDRLRYLMGNIIRNEGKFIIPKYFKAPKTKDK